MSDVQTWRRCSACKEPIALGAQYYTCNVSTCNRKRTALAFCSVTCWEVHLPGANHRESWAEEQVAPKAPEAAPAASSPAPKPAQSRSEPTRRLVRPTSSSSASDETPREVLIVASRLKDYVRARADFSTSERVLGPLSDIVREVVNEAIDNARRDGRKTVLDRDVPARVQRR